MDENIELFHRRNYIGIYNAGRTGTPVCLALTLLLVFLAILTKNPETTALLVLSGIFSSVFCFTFLLCRIIYGGKIKRVGSYEEIDILDNRIYYRSERSGLQVIIPGEIERIKIQKRPKGPLYNIEIFLKNTGNTLICPDSVTGYAELVNKLRSFANNNNIPLLR